MKKEINEILECTGGRLLQKGNNDFIYDLFFDSRKVKSGSAFVAVKGTRVDGHKFIESAVKNGAQLIVFENKPDILHNHVSYIEVDDSSSALSKIASCFFNYPSKSLRLVGVTGTNGKTTTVTLLYKLIKALGYKAGLISTVKNFVHNRELPATHTTPDPVQINRLMADMVNSGCEYCFMEVSSHAIDQKRVDKLDFDVAVFTNITHDHLDYHKTFENYLKAKKKFFDDLKNDATALLNVDDKNSAVMVQNSKASKKTYSLKRIADYRIKIEERHYSATQYFINNREVWSKLMGDFNAYNLIAVFGVADILGFEEEEILTSLSELKPVEGRMETITVSGKTPVIVDYAHTPDALENILSTLKIAGTPYDNITIVFGAGGDRDRKKRPEMGRIASIYCEKIILTSDNPRNEDTSVINEEIEKGIPANSRAEVYKITDRKEAIKVGLAITGTNDLLVITGKGHETYQEINGERKYFDDRETVFEFLKN